jgi:hypothetical protein
MIRSGPIAPPRTNAAQTTNEGKKILTRKITWDEHSSHLSLVVRHASADATLFMVASSKPATRFAKRAIGYATLTKVGTRVRPRAARSRVDTSRLVGSESC